MGHFVSFLAHAVLLRRTRGISRRESLTLLQDAQTAEVEVLSCSKSDIPGAGWVCYVPSWILIHIRVNQSILHVNYINEMNNQLFEWCFIVRGNIPPPGCWLFYANNDIMSYFKKKVSRIMMRSRRWTFYINANSGLYIMLALNSVNFSYICVLEFKK